MQHQVAVTLVDAAAATAKGKWSCRWLEGPSDPATTGRQTCFCSPRYRHDKVADLLLLLSSEGGNDATDDGLLLLLLLLVAPVSVAALR